VAGRIPDISRSMFRYRAKREGAGLVEDFLMDEHSSRLVG
jgi:hypothetical protein